ncbi:MAG: primosomal protein N' [Betaproteobacteria bacterium RIFCSPLOWO2_02_67_12]|nr:MAG: primosomal protein N' [Betaproteobacteria bacterium RIFCSPLOWO2_02_67_12]
MNLVRVALDVPIATLFDYLLPEAIEAQCGDRVVVPFGTRSRVGIAVETGLESALAAEKLKSVTRVLHDAPRLSCAWLDFMRFLASYYQRPLGETLVHALPPRLRSLKPLPRQIRQADPLSPSGTRFVSEHVLTEAQANAVDRMRSRLGHFDAFLLHGVTGSGKTEVYLRLIAEVLARGAQALVLVPEIGLTPQLEARVRNAFPQTHIAVLHSGLEELPRTAAWLSAARGDAGIVLGTRLAVLAPLPRLGLVVVDEEHDTSFKQHDGLRYSARDAAVARAKLAACPVVLGTATPSLESWHNGLAGRYQAIAIPQRAVPGSRMPQIRTVDLRAEPHEHGLARCVFEAIGQRLARREQSLVFINRRGYAPVLACEACGWAAGCERCSARLVLHAADRRLRCHHCGDEAPIPHACPTCGNVDLRAIGRGTQRVEETLGAVFAQARVLRIDRDSTRRRHELARTLEGIQRGEGDILVGTQLLAKGHDFPDLTLVCVLNADSALFSTDYRAAERLFATLVQVSGRAGRREQPGEVLVQTRFPDHPLFAALARHDYAGFAAAQLAERKAAGFPPFVFEAALRAEARKLEAALEFLRAAARAVPAGEEVLVYDPVPHVITRRAGAERAQLLMQSAQRPALQEYLRSLSEHLYGVRARGVRWHLEVDPIEFD